MKIEYGPPGHKGVTTIMGVGDDGLPAGASDLSYYGELAAIGVVVYGAATGNKKLMHAGGWASLLLIAFRLGNAPTK